MSSPEVWSSPVTLQDGRVGRYRGKPCAGCGHPPFRPEYAGFSCACGRGRHDAVGVECRKIECPECSDSEGRYKLPPGFVPERCGACYGEGCFVFVHPEDAAAALIDGVPNYTTVSSKPCPASCAAGLTFREGEG